jgi:phosphate starvation-inducible PhoH-like protein
MARKMKGFNKARGRGQQAFSEEVQEQPRAYIPKIVSEPLKAKTDNQKKYMNAIRSATLTFGVGPAGTGKTYICGAIAAELLQGKTIDKIIITRPAVEAGESLGFLPGEVEEKYGPYIQPLRSVLEKMLGKGQVDYFLKSKKIEAIPLAYMRGMTFDDAFVILDEAQNVTPTQMKMFLTRIGENCKVVIDGDLEQKDIAGQSGLEEAIKKISFIPSVQVVKFNDKDVVRSGLAAEIVQAYRS